MELNEPIKREIVKILLQDPVFHDHWKELMGALDISISDSQKMLRRFKNGDSTMNETIQTLLETWQSRNGSEATLNKLIFILKTEKFVLVAEQLQTLLIKVHSATTGDNLKLSPLTLVNRSSYESEGMAERHLKILNRLDYGSFSQVFKIESTFDSKTYALKTICIGEFIKLTTTRSGDAWEYFRKLMREVKNMAQLAEHPNIVTYHDAWFEGPLKSIFKGWLDNPPALPSPILPNTPTSNSQISLDKAMTTFMCIKMELMDSNLAVWLEKHPNLIGVLKTTTFITKEILTGLSFIHSKQIIHRDLKPNNILIDERVGLGQLMVKIGDFGLSRDMSSTDTSLTEQVGGKSFQSPEMERGHGSYDFKTDIFSVGLICLVMLQKFDSEAHLELTLKNVRNGNLDALLNIEKNYGKPLQLVRWMLKTNAGERPSSSEALAAISEG